MRDLCEILRDDFEKFLRNYGTKSFNHQIIGTCCLKSKKNIIITIYSKIFYYLTTSSKSLHNPSQTESKITAQIKNISIKFVLKWDQVPIIYFYSICPIYNMILSLLSHLFWSRTRYFLIKLEIVAKN